MNPDKNIKREDVDLLYKYRFEDAPEIIKSVSGIDLKRSTLERYINDKRFNLDVTILKLGANKYLTGADILKICDLK